MADALPFELLWQCSLWRQEVSFLRRAAVAYNSFTFVSPLPNGALNDQIFLKTVNKEYCLTHTSSSSGEPRTPEGGWAPPLTSTHEKEKKDPVCHQGRTNPSLLMSRVGS
ncbi:hypothetical protein E2C01_085607 [Portunus trituberculatus]|uniref:Uncharacterized protein n=1 Tax=Portunus trituberculatus TaxID=210409 RepID=A0A5B7J371_PORTR|nr:hypothetical protein [Portunus trituberculatus]